MWKNKFCQRAIFDFCMCFGCGTLWQARVTTDQMTIANNVHQPKAQSEQEARMHNADFFMVYLCVFRDCSARLGQLGLAGGFQLLAQYLGLEGG